MYRSRQASDHRVEQIVANLLRFGVLFASAVVLLGGVLYLKQHHAEAVNYQFFQGEPPDFRTPEAVGKAVISGRRRGIIQLGLLLLMATPVARVALSLLIFVHQRDFTYVVVTLIVLSGLAYSLLGG